MDVLGLGSRTENEINEFTSQKIMPSQSTIMRKKKKEAPKPPSASFLHSSFATFKKRTRTSTLSTFPVHTEGDITISTTSLMSNASLSSALSHKKRRAPPPPVKENMMNGNVPAQDKRLSN